MSGLSKLPVWTPIHTDKGDIYEAVDSRGRAWRMWFVEEDTPGDPFPRGWRYAPVDALDQANFIEHVGGLREFDTAALRIDPGEVAYDPKFRYRLGLDEPTD